MPHISETRAGEARASRNSCGGCFRASLTLSAYRAQHLIGGYGVRPDLAAMVAALAFGGGACHG